MTVLFCDLVGSTAIAERLDPEVYRELLDRYLELVFAEIYRFEGIVNQLAGDGLMALFGAPIAHEDAPERAVRAALAIQATLGELSKRLLAERGVALRARIGIHTGIVVVGTVGNDLKMDYTAIGDTTNLAARLQSLAEPGTILISEATHALGARRLPHARRSGPFDVKGKSEPVTAHEVLGVAERAPAIAASAAADAARRPRGGARAARGLLRPARDGPRAGGRDRRRRGQRQVAARLRVQAAPRRPRARAVRGALLVAHALGAVRAVGRRCCGTASTSRRATTSAAACEKIAQAPERRGGELRRGLRRSVLDAGADAGRAGAGDAEEPAKHRGFEAVSRLIERTSRRAPVVMIIEDLHWIDDASREMLEMAVARTGSARGDDRDHAPARVPAELAPNGAFTQLRLRPLGDGDAAQIVRARAGGALPRDLEERILRKADGNPFFARRSRARWSRTARSSRATARSSSTRRSTRSASPTRSARCSARASIACGRRRSASRRSRSVLGRQFRRRHVEALLEAEPIDVEAELAELERRGVLHRNGGWPIDEFRFGESLTQEVAYEGLLLRERRPLHERIAERARGRESRPDTAGDARGGLALAAHHFARGDDRARGIRALLAAAQQAQALPSYGDAMRLYREAWRLAELDARRDARADARAEAHRARGGRRHLQRGGRRTAIPRPSADPARGAARPRARRRGRRPRAALEPARGVRPGHAERRRGALRRRACAWSRRASSSRAAPARRSRRSAPRAG